jgi:glucoamylase
MESFEAWLEREYRYAAAAMLKSISAVDIVKTRPGFGQTIRPRKGSIVASTVLASWDPDPDYFFHWYRDSAVVMDALRLLHADGAVGAEALTHLRDFVNFSRSLRTLDGGALVADAGWRANVVEHFTQYCREDAELALIRGDTVVADTRVNPDGTLDISKWTRPQFDGPPLRALAVLRWVRSVAFDAELDAAALDLVGADLAFTLKHWREPSFDIWEEESGRHYYTLCVSAAALSEGAEWLESRGDPAQAAACRAASAEIRRVLDEFWLPEEGYYRSRILPSGERSSKDLDIAVILAAIHTDADAGGAHGPRDPRMLATLERLAALFDATYEINRSRPAGRAPAMGRYAGDRYFSGGAYYFSTLGAAELCYRAAAGFSAGATGPSAMSRETARNWVTKGDAYLATVRAFTPPGGELSEQFDQHTGSQTSAKDLAWSYAAFISCVTARRTVAGI